MANPGNPKMEKGRGGREGGDREGEREREKGRGRQAGKEGPERSRATS